MPNTNLTIEITRPDDWHLHLRDGEVLKQVLPYSENVFRRGLIMPNLNPPISDAVKSEAYYQKIIKFSKNNFQPQMAVYLTSQTTAQTVIDCKSNSNILAFKWYPLGATTNSDFGVTEKMILESQKMQEVIHAIIESEMVLCIHGEVVDNNIDIFAREQVFITRILIPLLKKHPQLKIVLEHISSKAGVDFICEYSKKHNIAATITAHHLAFNRNAILVGGIHPHYYCLPILKKESDRKALINAAISNNPAFFLGTDSAPHTQNAKENSCGCAGCFSAPIAINLYAQVFEQANAIDRLDDFAGKFGADFYGLATNKDKILLLKEKYQVAQSINSEDKPIVPFLAGEYLDWQVETN